MTGKPRERVQVIELRAQIEGEPERLDRYLGTHPLVPASRSRIQRLAVDGYIMVSGQIGRPRQKLQGGESIRIMIPSRTIPDLEGEDIPLEIIYEDEHLAVVNKAAGLVTHPGVGNRTGTLVHAMIHHFDSLSGAGESERPGIVHRLDKNTSGLLIVAKTDIIHEELQDAIRQRKIKRIYMALVCGHLKKTEDKIDLPIGRSNQLRQRMTVTDKRSREAITEYTVKERFRSYDLLEVRLQTGRTHQIRVHFSHLGHPVFGDPEYGGRDRWHRGQFAPERPLGKELLGIMERQALHAVELHFVHPISEKEIHLRADPPADFLAVLEILRERGT